MIDTGSVASYFIHLGDQTDCTSCSKWLPLNHDFIHCNNFDLGVYYLYLNLVFTIAINTNSDQLCSTKQKEKSITFCKIS